MCILNFVYTGVEFCELEIDAVWEIEWPFLQVDKSITVPCGVNFTGQLNVPHSL